MIIAINIMCAFMFMLSIYLYILWGAVQKNRDTINKCIDSLKATKDVLVEIDKAIEKIEDDINQLRANEVW